MIMAVGVPGWWYRGPSATSRALAPLARLYGALVVGRFRRAVPYVASLPVICVGNFTAGGTGKTPFVRLLVARLAAAGHRPAILSRGYGGRRRGPHWVAPGVDTAADVGDEPLLLAGDAPTLVARDRVAGARAIVEDPRDFTVVVMDDGLQNPALKKTLTFAVVDGARGLGNGCVMPAGPLRAPLAFQAGLVDAVVVNGGVGRASPIVGLPAGVPTLHVAVSPVGDASWLRGRRAVAFAGIGAPDKFFTMLDDIGADVVAAVPFADHHMLSAGEAADLIAQASAAGAELVTTEKDLVRLAGGVGRVADLAACARAVPIRLTVDPADAASLAHLLARAALRPGRAT